MAVLFHQKDFEELIIRKGKEFGDLVAAEVELEAYKNSEHLEYLFYVYTFCRTLKENNILYSVRYDDYPSYIMEILGVDNIHHFRFDRQSSKYGPIRNNRFKIYIPAGKRDDAIDLFCQIVSCSIHSDDEFLLHFGKDEEYQIELYQHVYLFRLSKIDKTAIDDIHLDESVINYMIQVDDKGYYMPNLFGCVFGSIESWYELINVIKPKSIQDLQKITSLMSCMFNNRKLLIKHIEEYGLANIIRCREQLYSILCDGYDIPKERVDVIRGSLIHLHRLSESDELILQSNEVPNYIIAQLNNIYYLAYEASSIVSIELIYQLAYLKFYYRDDFLKSLPSFKRQAYVGPFFYIDGCVHAHTESIKEFDLDLRFFDSKMTHYFFFFSLMMDGDYGNYPRGRVIYDNFHQQFIVYLDRSLMKKEIEEKIKYTFFLQKEKVVFKSDAQYTHDGL